MTSLRHYSKLNYSSNAVRSHRKNINSSQGKFSPPVGGSNNNQPSAYQDGWIEFYKLKFKVTPDVLIPRPETELLVDEVIRLVRDSFVVSSNNYQPTNQLTILDLGTGSGNIAISLACNLKGCKVNIIASDISQKALKIARQNAQLHGVKNKIKFVKSDLLSAFCHSGGRRPIESDEKDAKSDSSQASLIASLQHDNPDIIVTNLPYIPSARIPYLDSSVKDYEPHVALDGGEDGFGLYRKLFQQIAKFSLPPPSWANRPKGWKPKLIIGEIDYTHGELAANEAQKYFPDAQIEVRKDLAHLQRILTIRHITH